MIETMKEPWIVKTDGKEGQRFELHIGGRIQVLSLQEAEVLARGILLFMDVDVAKLEAENKTLKEKKIACPHCVRFMLLTDEGRRMMAEQDASETPISDVPITP